jgi:hypothetical protein
MQTQTCRQCHDLTAYKSAEKENMGFRLITEKAANRKESNGLETAKTKSTALSKEKKGAPKSQLFTARKMKLEIEHIINRRNRPGRQLK